MYIKHKKISYIAEINLKSTSAYKQQVLKMCDAFSKKGFTVTLYVINANGVKFEQLKRKYLLKSSFKIKEVFNKIEKLNFITRVIFSFIIYFKLKNKSGIIFSRSIFSSIILSLNKIVNVLEVHQPMSGFTNFLFNFFKRKISFYTKFILINKNINKYLNLKKKLYIVADDGVDLKDFNIKKKNKISKQLCLYRQFI
tara:strand:- start:39 stop:629 length:591 start_codon:yes stop_codon:yes gene_type:complete